MRLYHVTLRRNMESITREGVSPSYARGARRECWFVTYELLTWAVQHVSRRYEVGKDEVIAYEVLVRPESVTRRKKGIYTSFKVVNPIFIVDAFDESGYLLSYRFDRAKNGPMGA